MEKKYLEFYNRYAKDGIIPGAGLCWSIKGDLLELFLPIEEHPKHKHVWYWAYDGEDYGDWNSLAYSEQDKIMKTFTPLRQNIVLLMAAMTGEL